MKEQKFVESYSSSSVDFPEASSEFGAYMDGLNTFLSEQGWLELVRGWQGFTDFGDRENEGRTTTFFGLYLNKESDGIRCGRQLDLSGGFCQAEGVGWKSVGVMQRFKGRGDQSGYVRFEIDGMGTHYEKYVVVFYGADRSQIHLELSQKYSDFRRIWGNGSDGEENVTYYDNGGWDNSSRGGLERRGFDLSSLEKISIPDLLRFAKIILSEGIEVDFRSHASTNAQLLQVLAEAEG